MNCAECGGKTTVFQTRVKKDLPGIWRTRICTQCKHRVLTHETISSWRKDIPLTKKPTRELDYVAGLVEHVAGRASRERLAQQGMDARREIENLLETRTLDEYD